MKKLLSKEAKIGIAFIISLLVLYTGINFLKGINIFKSSNTYTVVFNDVSGLTLSSPVVLNGFQVGLVQSMDLDMADGGKINVNLNLSKGIKIPKDSRIKLDVSLMGSATVIIEANKNTQEYYTTDDKIQGIRQVGLMESMGQGVLPQVGDIVPKIDSLLVGINLLVSNPKLAQTLDNVESITHDLAMETKQLHQMLSTLNKDLPALLNNTKAITGNLASTTDQFKSLDINSTYRSLDATMKNVEQLTSKLNSKDNSLGLLLNDKALYDSLSITIGGASQLMKDLKENPSRYINVKVF